MNATSSGRPSAARQALGTLLVILAALAGLLGGVAAYLDDRVVDRRAFADSSLDALDREAVSNAVARELTAQLLERFPAAIVPREQVERAADDIVSTPAFRRAFRRGAADVNALLFTRGDEDATLRLDISAALADVDPRLARALPPGLSAKLLTVRGDTLGVGTPKIADAAGTLKTVLPLLALVLLVAGLLAASDRRRAVRAGAIATVLGAGALLLVLAFGRSFALDQVEASRGLTVDEARAAAGDVWDAYAEDLRSRLLIALAAGVAVTLVTLLPWGRARRSLS